MWKTAFKKFEVIWSAYAYHITSNYLKAVFHKFYLVILEYLDSNGFDKVPKTYPLLTHFFHFSNIFNWQWWVLQPFRNLLWYFEETPSKKAEIWANVILSKKIDKSLMYSFLLSLFCPFCVRHDISQFFYTFIQII